MLNQLDLQIQPLEMNNNRSTEIEDIDNIKLTIMINIYAFNFMRNNFYLNFR